jgi:hypothetical protein
MQQKQSTYIFIAIAQSIGKAYCPFVPRETVCKHHVALHNVAVQYVAMQYQAKLS